MINEVKGYLFEYLFGLELSKKSKIESSFLQGISNEYIDMLSIHERFLLNNEPQLLTSLQFLAAKSAQDVFSQVSGITKVELVGKNSESSNEGDVKIELGSKQVKFLSLKLCKASSYVNTKSGGVGSFICKYLTSPLAGKLQSEFDDYHSYAFEVFKAELFDFYDFDPELSFLDWKKEGLPTRPGDLPSELKPVTKRYYSSLNNKVFEIIRENNFTSDDLLKLSGFSSQNMLQVVCLYTGDYEFSHLYLLSAQDLVSSNIKIENNEESSYFMILMGQRKMQIRLKPMKEFIQKSLKVNCSLYFK